MSNSALVVITDDGSTEDAKALSQALHDGWPIGSPPVIRIASHDECKSTPPAPGTARLLLATGSSGARQVRFITNCIDQAREDGAPVLVVGEITNPNRPDLVDVPAVAAATEPATIAAVLAGMLDRQSEIRSLRTQAAATARVVDNVQEEMTKIDEELQAAGIVQRNFLPDQLPRIGSIDVGALWRPTSYVSGDYYDVRRVDDTTIGVLLVDAAGHGVPSALMTMIIARAFDWAQAEHPHRPELVMKTLNNELCFQQAGITRFATGVYALIDCTDGTMTYCSAGHPPPLLLDRSVLRPLPNEQAGGLLGVFPEQTFEPMTYPLIPGETLLLHSDGFEQAFPLPDADPNEMTMPTNAYLEVFKSLSDLKDTDEMVKRISGAIDARRGSLHPCDDLTLLCVHRLGEAATLRRAA